VNDTHPDIEVKVRAMLMAKSGAERLIMGCQMFETARTIALASAPAGLTEREQKAWLARRFYADEPALVERFIASLG
jgi:hypothetical protein